MSSIKEAPLSEMLEQSSVALETGISLPHAFNAVKQVQVDANCRELAAIIAQTPLRLLPATIARKFAHDPDFKLPATELNSLQLCLLLSERTGTGIATLLNTLANNLRDETDAFRARESAFAGAKVTAKILMALPLAALALGYAIGAKPLQVLLSSFTGYLMLFAGIFLTLVGWVWMRKLLQAAATPSQVLDPLLLVDLLGQIISAGVPLPKALQAIGSCLQIIANNQNSAVSGEQLWLLSERFGTAANLLLQGSGAQVALADLPEELRAVSQSVTLSQTTGAQLSPLLFAAVRNQRRANRREVERASAALAVKLVLPTGVTILPAFVVLGIIPVITDLLASHFG